MIAQLRLKNFQAFRDLSIKFSPGINIIVGENSTGKTQILKAAYFLLYGDSMFDPFLSAHVSKDPVRERSLLTEKLLQIFKPLDTQLRAMCHSDATAESEMSFCLDEFNALSRFARVSFRKSSDSIGIESNYDYGRSSVVPSFIPTKEVLSFMEGFSSLYERYRLPFDQTYQDICLSLDLPELNPTQIRPEAQKAIERIEQICGGRFVFQGGGKVTFQSQAAEYSTNAVAEGLRKVGILARLLSTGAIQPGAGSALFWDEPEANLNPKLMRALVEILVELSREGQQIVLATHEYVLLKWFDLLVDREKDHPILFHTLHRDIDTNDIQVTTVDNYLAVSPNPISDVYKEITQTQVRQQIGNLN